MSFTPAISVVIPTLNEAAHITATLANVRATLPAAEIIVADGGSTDGTPHLYDELGGFPSWPLFEDVELLRRARRVTRVWSLPACVTTSARRFRRHGQLRQQLRNAVLLLRFLAGTPPHVLALEYRRAGPEAVPNASATRATSRKESSRIG